MEEQTSLEIKESGQEAENKYVFCHKCGTKNLATNSICVNCEATLILDEENEDDVVRCPSCGSKNIDFVTYQASSNFDKGDACCGYLLCGPLGLLCGAKDNTEAKTVRKCKKCGKEF